MPVLTEEKFSLSEKQSKRHMCLFKLEDATGQVCNTACCRRQSDLTGKSIIHSKETTRRAVTVYFFLLAYLHIFAFLFDSTLENCQKWAKWRSIFACFCDEIVHFLKENRQLRRAVCANTAITGGSRFRFSIISGCLLKFVEKHGTLDMRLEILLRLRARADASNRGNPLFYRIKSFSNRILGIFQEHVRRITFLRK